MIQFRQQFIVDASVVIKWFVREEGSDRALAIADRAADGQIELSLPDFCLVECADVIWRLVVKQRTLPAQRGEMVVAQLTELPIVGVPSRDLTGAAYGLAVETGATVYDCMYVALAKALDAVLVTADRALYRRLSNTEYGSLVQML